MSDCVEKIFEQIERGGIEPLQIVEEERQRMLRARKDADEPPQHRLEAALRILRWQIGDRRLFADDEFQLGDEVHDQQPVRAQRLAKRLPPALELRLALAQNLPDQTLKGLRQRGVRDVALVLIELAGGEEAARRDQHLVQFIHHRGFADAGISGDENEFRHAGGDDAIEMRRAGRRPRARGRRVSRGSAADPACRARASGKSSMRPLHLPFGAAPSKIVLDAGGGLVALLGGLGEQLHDKLGNRRRDGLQPLTRRHRRSGDVAMDPFHGVMRG